eukprot:3266768-Rhodomonas_salina.1
MLVDYDEAHASHLLHVSLAVLAADPTTVPDTAYVPNDHRSVHTRACPPGTQRRPLPPPPPAPPPC